MNRFDFQRLSGLRLKEAEVLLNSGYFEGAYYLLGYVVECALKACISKNTSAYDFPPKMAVISAIYSHDLVKLLNASGIGVLHQEEIQRNPAFEKNWSTVKDWTEESRYSTGIGEKRARDLHSAIVDINSGVLPWFTKLW